MQWSPPNAVVAANTCGSAGPLARTVPSPLCISRAKGAAARTVPRVECNIRANPSVQEPCQYSTTCLIPQSVTSPYAAFVRGIPRPKRRPREGAARPPASSVPASHPRFFSFFLFTGVTDSTRHQFLLFSDMSTHVYSCLRPLLQASVDTIIQLVPFVWFIFYVCLRCLHYLLHLDIPHHLIRWHFKTYVRLTIRAKA